MQVFASGSDVPVTIPFELTLPTNASYSVIDELGNVIVEDVVVPVPSEGTFVTFTVPAINNTITELDRALRTVTLTVSDVNGEQTVAEERYIVTQSLELTIPSQSFQTIGQSILNSSDIPNIDAFELADDSNKRKAMFEAARRIASLRFAVEGRNRQDYLEFSGDAGSIEDLQAFTSEQWFQLPKKFRLALMRAQLVEADDILGGNPIEDQRRAGLMSHTVSESKHFYRPGKPIETPLGKRALGYLSEYLGIGSSLSIRRG